MDRLFFFPLVWGSSDRDRYSVLRLLRTWKYTCIRGTGFFSISLPTPQGFSGGCELLTAVGTQGLCHV